MIMSGQVSSSASDAVRYTPQALTDEQKAQARVNIGAGTEQSAVCYTKQALSDAQKLQARENINASPGGFGLGGPNGRTANSFSDITGYGFYRVPSESGFAPDASSNWGAIYIGATLSYGTLLYCRNGALMAVRSVENGNIGEIEWINPPLQAGVSYRTTDRYKGQVVYKKLDTDGIVKWRTDSFDWRATVTYGTADLQAGTSALPTGQLYVVYE